MGIFDFFKKKKENKENSAPENIVKEAEVFNPQVTEPQTTNKEEEKVVPKEMADFDALSLGELFEKAADDLPARMEFYKRFAQDNLYIITSQGEPSGADGKEMKWQILNLNSGEIPVFTSEDKVYDNGAVKEKKNVISLKLSQLYEATKGSKYVLNPFSYMHKEFSPSEVEHTLDGSIIEMMNQPQPQQQRRKVRLGVPAYCPQEMVDAIKQKLSEFSTVLEVYLAYMEFPDEPNEPPHYAFGVHGGLNQEVAQSIAQAVAPYLSGKGNVDVMPIGQGGKGSLDEYFLSTKPIYTNPERS